jgi:hypothetical protein
MTKMKDVGPKTRQRRALDSSPDSCVLALFSLVSIPSSNPPRSQFSHRITLFHPPYDSNSGTLRCSDPTFLHRLNNQPP